MYIDLSGAKMIKFSKDAGFTDFDSIEKSQVVSLAHYFTDFSTIPGTEPCKDDIINQNGGRPKICKIRLDMANGDWFSFDIQDVQGHATWLHTNAGLLVAMADINAALNA